MMGKMKQLSFDYAVVEQLRSNVFDLQSQLNKSYIRIKELTQELNHKKIHSDYWDGSINYDEWSKKYQKDREA